MIDSIKLRNKKTGFIGYIEYNLSVIDLETGNRLLTVRYKDDRSNNCYKDYETIEEFNEDWEDYKPVEPLIKDEKICKAVRAWAEVNEIKPDYVMQYSSGTFALQSWQADIEFNTNIKGLADGEFYTITELCGELNNA